MKQLILLLMIACLVQSAASAQTKKIANASHASKGAMFNWTSSDNAGWVGDYDDIVKKKIIPADSNLNKSGKDSCVKAPIVPGPMDTLKSQQKDSPKPEKARKEKNKIKQKDKKKAKNKVKAKEESLKKSLEHEEVVLVPKGKEEPQSLRIKPKPTKSNQQAGMGWFGLLLLVPALYLVFKKS